MNAHDRLRAHIEDKLERNDLARRELPDAILRAVFSETGTLPQSWWPKGVMGGGGGAHYVKVADLRALLMGEETK